MRVAINSLSARCRYYISALLLTFGSVPGYTAPMPIHFILPKKFTRADIESHMDTLALKSQGTKDKKIIAQIAGLNRLLAQMDARCADLSQPKNRQ